MRKKIKVCPHPPQRKSYSRGFSVLELVLAGALFAVFSAAIAVVILQGSSATQASGRSEIARQWALEGIEATRALRDQSFEALSDTAGSGIRFVNGKWELFSSQDSWEGYRRVISIQPVERDSDGNLVSNGGSVDTDLKMVKVIVTKDNFSIEFSTYLARREIVITP